jgi:Spy/CpxP family protein refolding chaperone
MKRTAYGPGVLFLASVFGVQPLSAAGAEPIPDEARKPLVEVLGGPFLVYRDQVQEELKLSDEQKQKLLDKFPEYVEATMNVFEKIKDAKPEEREKTMQEHRKKSGEKLSAFLKDVLEAKQQQRLFQLQLQQAGVFALLGENEAFKPLKITEDQRKQFREVVHEMHKKIAPLAKEAETGGKPEEIRAKAMKIRKEQQGKIEALLSDAQKKQWKELLGKPFDLKD